MQEPDGGLAFDEKFFLAWPEGHQTASDSAARRRLFVRFVLLSLNRMTPPTSSWWTWLAVAALGTFHGLNPAMGWLFAVALGLYRRSRRVVLLSLVPIALGHALAAGSMLMAGLSLGMVIDHTVLNRVCGTLLIGWAAWHALARSSDATAGRNANGLCRPDGLVVCNGGFAWRRPHVDSRADADMQCLV